MATAAHLSRWTIHKGGGAPAAHHPLRILRTSPLPSSGKLHFGFDAFDVLLCERQRTDRLRQLGEIERRRVLRIIVAAEIALLDVDAPRAAVPVFILHLLRRL